MSDDEIPLNTRPKTIEDADDVLNNICDILDKAATQKKSISKEYLTEALDALEYTAPRFGISQEYLLDFVNISVVKSFLDQATANKLIKNLYPRQKIEAEVVIKIVGSLGLGAIKPSLPTQTQLLRWLVMVYDFIDDLKVLARFYDLLFSLLDMITLRPILCHLLSILTQRRHVKPFRIQTLLELKNKFGPEPALLGLLQVFKNYFPDVIVGEIGKLRAGLFAHPKPDWLRTARSILERHADDHDRGSGSFRVSRKFGDEGVKRRKTGGRAIIPRAFTAGAHEASITVDEIENVNDLASKFYRIELPSQLASTLSNPLLRRVVALRQPENISSRIDNWLSACLFEEFSLSGRIFSPSEDSSTSELLHNLLEYTRFTKVLLPSVESFLRELLKAWDGKVYRDAVLGLFSFLGIREFEELQQSFLVPLEKVLLPVSSDRKADEAAAASLINTFSALLQNWMLDFTKDSEPDKETSETVRKYVEYVSEISVEAFAKHDCSIPLAAAILTSQEVNASLSARNQRFRLVLPPDILIYRLLFTPDSMMLSRLCGLIESYMKIFKDASETDAYPRATLDKCNSFVIDVCNCLWRNRAFGRQDKNALGCSVPESLVTVIQSIASTRDLSLNSAFNISNSITLNTVQASAFKKRFGRDASEPITQRLFKSNDLNMDYKDFRTLVFEECKRRDLTGFPNLMYRVII